MLRRVVVEVTERHRAVLRRGDAGDAGRDVVVPALVADYRARRHVLVDPLRCADARHGARVDAVEGDAHEQRHHDDDADADAGGDGDGRTERLELSREAAERRERAR